MDFIIQDELSDVFGPVIGATVIKGMRHKVREQSCICELVVFYDNLRVAMSKMNAI